MPLPPGADEQPPRPTRQSQRPRRAPAAPDKTPPPPIQIQRKSAHVFQQVRQPALAMCSKPTSPMPLWAMVLVRQKILLEDRNDALHRVLALVRVVDNATHRVLFLMPLRLLLVVAEQRVVAPDGVKRECAFCNTSTGILRRHLYERHLEAWVQGCDQLKIEITAREALPHVEAYRGKQNGSNSSSTADSAKKQPPFSNEAFVDAIVEWIVSDDQSINVIENEKLRNIFLMLRAELKDSDIPHPCKAVSSAMTNMDFAAPGADDFVPGDAEPRTFLDAIARDPIATVRTSVRVIRASSLRLLKALHMRDLQLLRDVDTRWSSTLIMIDRAVLLQEAIDKFLTETQDLKEMQAQQARMGGLEGIPAYTLKTTPTLGHALPAFEAMIAQWEKQQTCHPETADIVQQGINKLDDYRERISLLVLWHIISADPISSRQSSYQVELV
ncbi:hypothetical protein R3P38DRAFT_2758829 [Favolaschia claudopus]|uniref:BED-type domain-containing protein n=1 Tax=Favolaschia claudopus TaxID=2862362 RepID=A0AAW0E735_9AGAR